MDLGNVVGSVAGSFLPGVGNVVGDFIGDTIDDLFGGSQWPEGGYDSSGVFQPGDWSARLAYTNKRISDYKLNGLIDTSDPKLNTAMRLPSGWQDAIEPILNGYAATKIADKNLSDLSGVGTEKKSSSTLLKVGAILSGLYFFGGK